MLKNYLFLCHNNNVTLLKVIKEALYLLQQKQLEMHYREANQEIDPTYDNTTLDGIEDNEAW